MKRLVSLLAGCVLLGMAAGCDETLLSALPAEVAALVADGGAKDAVAMAPIRDRDQVQQRLKDGSCASPIRDRTRDQTQQGDRDQTQQRLRDGSCQTP